MDHAIQESERSLEGAANDTGDEVATSAKQRLVGLVDGEINQFEIGASNSVRDGLIKILEVAQKHREEEKGGFLTSPQGSVVGKQRLCEAKQAINGFFIEPLSHLD
uniref:Uncharacterized protein n=1 Tax=Photinus pyralis TaxID=7054 RepID=A0A1Y1K7C2_PHOPY